MTSQLLYNTEGLEDVIHVLSFINSYTTGLGIKGAVLDVDIVQRVVNSCRADFPHNGGVEQASGFKQAANFVCHFVAERPLLDPFPKEIVGDLVKVDNHQNAILAFALASQALNKSDIQRKDGIITIQNPILLSKHSYVDVIEALSNIT